MVLILTSGARLSQWRKACRTTEDKKKVMQAKTEHVAGVFANRGCARRLMLASESAGRADLQLPRDKACLYISIDGVDRVGFFKLVLNSVLPNQNLQHFPLSVIAS